MSCKALCVAPSTVPTIPSDAPRTPRANRSSFLLYLSFAALLLPLASCPVLLGTHNTTKVPLLSWTTRRSPTDRSAGLHRKRLHGSGDSLQDNLQASQQAARTEIIPRDRVQASTLSISVSPACLSEKTKNEGPGASPSLSSGLAR